MSGRVDLSHTSSFVFGIGRKLLLFVCWDHSGRHKGCPYQQDPWYAVAFEATQLEHDSSRLPFVATEDSIAVDPADEVYINFVSGWIHKCTPQR